MGLLDAVKGAYHQVNMWDDNRTWRTHYDSKKPSAGGGGGGGGWGTSTASSSSNAASDAAREMARLRAELNSMRYSPPVPRLASFDIMSNWRNAQSAAERAQNPLYEKKLNDFLARNAQKKATKNTEFDLTKENINLEKSQAFEDSALSRARTTEDVTGAIDKINQQEGYYQQDEGRSFDTEYRQAAEELATQGAATTGLGKQASSDMVRLRNVTNTRQLDEFKGMREAKNLFKTRTFEDLARADVRADIAATNKTKGAQIDFDSYLEDLAYDEKVFKFENEQQRLEAVLRDTGNYEKAGVESFLASLAGKGYNAQEIALARQTYA